MNAFVMDENLFRKLSSQSLLSWKLSMLLKANNNKKELKEENVKTADTYLVLALGFKCHSVLLGLFQLGTVVLSVAFFDRKITF